MVKKMQKGSCFDLKKTALLLSILLTLSALFANPVSAYGNPPSGKIYLNPSATRWTTLVHKVNDTFTLEVRITNVTECFLIVFSLQWNATLLNLISVTKGDVLEGTDITTTFLVSSRPPSAGGPPSNPNDILGEATYARLADIGVTIQPPSSGLVATVTFKAMQLPPAGFPINLSISFVNSSDWGTVWGTPALIYYDFQVMTPNAFYFEGIYTTITQIVADGQTFSVAIKSNSSTTTPVFSKLLPSGGSLTFNVTGASGTAGFSNVTIPKGLMWINVGQSWLITVNGADVTSLCTITQNSTHTSIYIPYSHSQQTIDIVAPNAIPEFPAVALVPIFMVVILFATLLTIKSNSKKRKSPSV